MYSVVHTAVLSGIDACLVSVEADISNGMPMFEMVGLLASEVRDFGVAKSCGPGAGAGRHVSLSIRTAH